MKIHSTSTQQTFAKGSVTTEKCPSHIKTGKISSLVSRNYILLPMKVELEQTYEGHCVKYVVRGYQLEQGKHK